MTVDKNIIQQLSYNILHKIGICENIVIVCLGTTKIIADCFGPLVGQLLKQQHNINCYVYGDINHSITKSTLPFYFELLAKKHSNSKIIALDCAIGKAMEVGTIKTYNCGLVPRSGIDNSFGLIGDASIIGILASSNGIVDNFLYVQKQFVKQMAQITANAINEYVSLCNILSQKDEIV